jgi:peptidoglycan/LPS O-acetylase OafA/YrhL
VSFESLPRHGEQNHFNLIRMIAASSVIVSHSANLSRAWDTPDPLYTLIGIDLGATAVLAFFAISGYFISLSFERRTSNFGFVLARVTRIIPALLVVSLTCAFVIGPLFTAEPLSGYFSDRKVWLYPLENISIVGILEAIGLPGVFMNNPTPEVVNGPLWTLFFEATCYAGLFLTGVLGLLRRKRFAVLVLAWLPAYLIARYGPWPQLKYFAIFSLPFVVGMGVYHFRAWGICNGRVALALFAAAFALIVTGHGIEELWSVAIAYGVLWLGFARAPALLPYNKLGDFSYGTYIWGFPAGQVVAALSPGIGIPAMIALTLPLGVLCGALSWYCVERPALELRKLGDTPRSQAATMA